MGNCQAAEVATVVIQHPGGNVERLYWSISASRVMADNPGHYVAVIITAPVIYSSDKNTSNNSNAGTGNKHNRRRDSGKKDCHAQVKHLKLLRPDDMLLMGHVYRLVSFEEVVRKFETKRHAKLSKLVANSSNMEMELSTSSKDAKRETGKESGTAMKVESGNNQTNTICDKNNEDEAHCNKNNEDEETDELVSVAQALLLAGNNNRSLGSRHGQWRPALQSIAEVAGS